VWRTPDPGLCIIEFTDDATAFNGEKRGSIGGKGRINAATTAIFSELVEQRGVPTHFLELLSPTDVLARSVEIVPVEVVVRNLAAGSFSKRLGVPEGVELKRPIVEFSYKRDDLGDPLLTRSHIEVLELAPADVVEQLEERALEVNGILAPHLAERGITLVDFKLEFGHTAEGVLLLADEISPDTCRFWDATTGEKLDKDRFRRDLGNVEEAYEQLLERLGRVGVTA